VTEEKKTAAESKKNAASDEKKAGAEGKKSAPKEKKPAVEVTNIAAVEETKPATEAKNTAPATGTEEKKIYRRINRRHKGKRWKNMRKESQPGTLYTVPEAVKFLKGHKAKGFVETVELAVKLDIDPRQSEQQMRGSFVLPNGTGKTRRVAVFAEGADADAAKQNGADAVGGKDLVEKIEKGWFDFDIAIAHPNMMRFVGKLGKVLGPKGLMPSPKSGTVTEYIGNAVKEFKGGKIEFRNDDFGNIHVGVGKLDFADQKIVENIEAFVGHIRAIRPASVKGQFITKVTVSSTMGMGLKLSI
jgi:large subunit ribosomal protein L1